jgi:hypothetical protein
LNRRIIEDTMSIKVSLRNSGGELDSRVVDSEEEAHAAALELIAVTAYLSVGDTLTVTETDED